jgi:hypothetical protein
MRNKERLRASLDTNDTFVSGGHGIFKTAGATRHAARMSRIPVWALNDKSIKALIESRFPKAAIDSNQRKQAARMIRIIYLYYRVGLTSAGVAEALKMTPLAVRQAIHRIEKAMSAPLKPPHRPKKPVTIDTTSGRQGVDHISL